MKRAISYQLSVVSKAKMLTAVIALGMAFPGVAGAMAVSGTLLTNMVSVTFGTAPTSGVQVQVSYGGTAAVLVQNPTLSVSKYATPTLQASGSDVTFRVCVMNLSATASAFNVAVVDRLPDNMEWAGAATTMWSMGVPAGTWTETSSASFPGPYGVAAPASGQDYPYYMRWVLTHLGPGRSGCVEFRARIL